MPTKPLEVFISLTPSSCSRVSRQRGVQRLMRDIEVHGDQMTFNGTISFSTQRQRAGSGLRPEARAQRLRMWRGLAVICDVGCGTQTNQGASAPNAALSTRKSVCPSQYRSEVAGDIVHVCSPVDAGKNRRDWLVRSARIPSLCVYHAPLAHVGLEMPGNRPPSSCWSSCRRSRSKFARLCGLGRECGTRLLSSTKGENSGRRKRLPRGECAVVWILTARKGTSRGVTALVSRKLTLMEKSRAGLPARCWQLNPSNTT